MFSDLARKKTEGAVTQVARVLQKIGLTPNLITLIGVSFMFMIGYALSQGYLATSGFLIVFAGGFDALDGSLARLTGTVSKFGGFLDSVTDRYAEVALFTGIFHYLLAQGYSVFPTMYLMMAALFGSIMVSYNRARAEGLGFECKGGMFSRFERLVVLVFGLVLTSVFGDISIIITMVIMAIFTNITAIQRIQSVYDSDNALTAKTNEKK